MGAVDQEQSVGQQRHEDLHLPPASPIGSQWERLQRRGRPNQERRGRPRLNVIPKTACFALTILPRPLECLKGGVETVRSSGCPGPSDTWRFAPTWEDCSLRGRCLCHPVFSQEGKDSRCCLLLAGEEQQHV